MSGLIAEFVLQFVFHFEFQRLVWLTGIQKHSNTVSAFDYLQLKFIYIYFVILSNITGVWFFVIFVVLVNMSISLRPES